MAKDEKNEYKAAVKKFEDLLKQYSNDMTRFGFRTDNMFKQLRDMHRHIARGEYSKAEEKLYSFSRDFEAAVKALNEARKAEKNIQAPTDTINKGKQRRK